jgi:hypothetical protein
MGPLVPLERALEIVKRSRECCNVNSGFSRQLEIWDHVLRAAAAEGESVQRQPDRWWSNRAIVARVVAVDAGALAYASPTLKRDAALLKLGRRAK